MKPLGVRGWLALQRLAILAWFAGLVFFGANGATAVSAVAWGLGALLLASLVFDPRRPWWADEVRSHASDPVALRRDRRGSLIAIAIGLLVLVLVPPVLTMAGWWRAVLPPG